MKKFLFLITLITGFLACDCDEPGIIIIEEELPGLFLANPRYDDGTLLVVFNKELDTATVIPDETFFIEGAEFDPSLLYKDNFILAISQCDLICLQDSCDIRVTLKGGTREEPLVSTPFGQALDGDKNGNDGGDLVFDFTVTTCFAPRVISEGFSQAFSPNQIQVTIQFDQKMNQSSVIENAVFYRTDDSGTPLTGIEGFFEFEDEGINGTFYTTETIPPDCIGDKCYYKLFFDGSGLVRSATGITLDGDGDGKPGGDYEYKFEVFF